MEILELKYKISEIKKKCIGFAYQQNKDGRRKIQLT